MVIRLKKQRYTCKNCRSHWNAQSYFIRPRHSISNHVRHKITSLLTEKVSLFFYFEKLLGIFDNRYSHIERVEKLFTKVFQKNSVLSVEGCEFRSHVSVEDKLSFISADGETEKLIEKIYLHKKFLD